jgi:hypothetical protein
VANLGAVVTSNYWDTMSERPRNARQVGQQRQDILHQQQRGSKESLFDVSDEESGTGLRPSLVRTTTTTTATTTTTTIQATESRWTAKEKELFIEAFVRSGKVFITFKYSHTFSDCNLGMESAVGVHWKQISHAV